MTVARYRQGSLLPELVPDRPEGRIPGSVQTGTNADLIATVAPLYLTGSVCDVTYGEGGWWRRFRPGPFVAHDLDPAKGDGVDFTRLPEADRTYDAVTFDPPYVPAGGYATSRLPAFHNGYGLRQQSITALRQAVDAGLAEATRVSRRWVLVKCMDFVSSGAFHVEHVRVLGRAAELGLRCRDLIVHHAGAGPGGQNISTVLRARRHHSYLLVFEVP